MSSSKKPAGNGWEDLVLIARAVKTRGLKGEVDCELLTDYPERFEGLRRVRALIEGQWEDLAIESYSIRKGRVVLKFEGYDSINGARGLVGCEFAVPESECVALSEDEYYDWELEGCGVETISGEPIGQVRKILKTGAAPLLVVSADSEIRDHLIPLAEAICVEIDLSKKLIRVDAPEGLLEL